MKKQRPTRRERRAAARTASSAGSPPGGGVARSSPGLPAGSAGFRGLAGRGTLALALLVVASYLPALQAGFVWDDLILTEEPVLHDWSGLWNIWFSPADIVNEGHYWPVVYTSFWLEHKLWGLAPFGYHAVNVLLHLVNVLLVWRLLLRLSAPGAWIVAAVFAVHPLHVESVAWVIERKDLLSGLFYLTAALTWIGFVETPTAKRYGLALGLFTAGLLSKSIVVTLPAALLVWHWWRWGRVTRADLTRLAPFFAVALVVTALDLSFYATREPLALGYSLVERVLIAARALWFYAGKLLWPADLAVIYPLWEIDAADPAAWAYVLAAAALPAALWFGRSRLGRGPLAGALFFAVTLSPVLGFVDYGYMQFSLVADRFQYLAGLGVIAVLVGGAARGAGRLPAAARRGVAGGLVAVLALLGALTWGQAGVYRDEVTFFSHVIALNPHARDAHFNLAGPLADAGRLDEALAAARTALARRPDSANAHARLGRVLMLREEFDEAEAVLRTALELAPRNSITRQNLAATLHNAAEELRRAGRHHEAVASYREALGLNPALGPTHLGLGAALVDARRYEEAFEALSRAVSLDLDAGRTAAAHYLAGLALQGLDRPAEAAVRFERAIELDSGHYRALDQLARWRFGQQEYEGALELYRAMAVLEPDDVTVHANVGVTLYYLGRPEESLASLDRVLRLEPEHETARSLVDVLRAPER